MTNSLKMQSNGFSKAEGMREGARPARAKLATASSLESLHPLLNYLSYLQLLIDVECKTFSCRAVSRHIWVFAT